MKLPSCVLSYSLIFFFILKQLYAVNSTNLLPPLSLNPLFRVWKTASQTLTKSWNTLYKLKLNDDKTKALLIHKLNTSSSLSSYLPISFRVGTTYIQFSSSERNLDYILSDVDLSFNNHIFRYYRSALTAIRQISFFCHYLTITATKTLVCAFVFSCLDYCISQLAGSPIYIIDKLKKRFRTQQLD